MSDIKVSDNLTFDKFEIVKQRGETFLMSGVAVSWGRGNQQAITNTMEMVKRWNSHDHLTARVAELEVALSDACDTLSIAANYCDVAIKESEIDGLRKVLNNGVK